MKVQAVLQSLTRPDRVRERVPPVVWGEPSFTTLMSFSTAATASCASLTRLCACATWRCALRPSAWQWDQAHDHCRILAEVQLRLMGVRVACMHGLCICAVQH